jgi:hypothetical protein
MNLVMKEYALADEAIAKAMGLPHQEGGYGLLFCEEGDSGKHVTRAGDPFITTMLANGVSVNEEEITRKFPYAVDGWPDEWKDGRPKR